MSDMPGDCNIEPMSIDDYEEVICLWRKTEGVGLNESDSKPNIARFLKRNPGLSLVARSQGGVIVGAVLGSQDGRNGYLYHLAIDKEWRRKGIGISLVEKCLSEFRSIGLQRGSIFVYTDNAEGKAFWLRHGWKERDELRMMQKATGDIPAS
jgi:putative acetyltransferase